MFRSLLITVLLYPFLSTGAVTFQQDGSEFEQVMSDGDGQPGKLNWNQLMSLEDETIQESVPDVAHDERMLQTTYSVPCPGGGPVHYFSLSIQFALQPSVDLSKCTTTMKQNIGTDLNALILKYGIGAEGVGDGAVYAGSVCTKPTTVSNRRRRLAIIGFVWRGGGTCRQCSTDNRDGRRLGRLQRRLYDPNWFRNIYIPEMQNTLRNAITNTIVPKHTICLAGGPQVLVAITEVTSTQVKTGC